MDEVGENIFFPKPGLCPDFITITATKLQREVGEIMHCDFICF
jgi:hypothetical protein